ncbi:MAG: hypothetical protein ACK5VA_10095 [Pseudanabaena sp.]|jgi:hypothetical protein|nr:hypothetical protein [Pseudanabaena sp. M090S1SP2A07QC]MCA6508394.1 hypothetical protein [Pseudanabaena sp. M172S2SP2A07QC]MCA6510208.1 hypothetical protein [Pseudanabaena sp. M109S1SP2A07QC]MCA6518042.1 hypothetical protein [Pseudanabaena sp. M110S1SP2A07QC]MCA6522078.1 hypothetical protein [Pseudanabaena sp. M051S1SP2A07QC]MCA6527040.1 hypothetical protein [Pseudanabaena sp. M179S2SP2A07QC]MCA6532108.1 hypothetical protein [Pseudanabaena sp. M125S2SP2A07QC]MCA6534192.1 hypothetical prot
MPKFHAYIGIAAIALVSCQQTPSNNSTALANNLATEKAISYLRSQLKLPPTMAIVAESQKTQPANTNDLCQTTAPTQAGFEIALVAEDMRYTLQTNQDASKIEICRSEDAKPETTGKYTGAGYMLRYPADWKAIDLGLEPSGASTVIFTPSRELPVGEDKSDLVKKLQQSQQVYTVVSRQPIDGKAIASDGSDKAKDLVKIPFDPKVKGAKSGSKEEFTTAIATGDASNKPTNWKVKVLTLEAEKFIYTVRYYQPDSQNAVNSPNSSAFDQFANSFALIP